MNRGGARKGAGRKRSEVRRRNITLSVDDATRERMAYLRGRGMKISREFEAWIAKRHDMETARERAKD